MLCWRIRSTHQGHLLVNDLGHVNPTQPVSSHI